MTRRTYMTDGKGKWIVLIREQEHYEEKEVTDPDLIAKLEAGELLPLDQLGSVFRPMTDESYERFKRKMEEREREERERGR